MSDIKKQLAEMNRVTRDWTMRAARNECAWICADCSCSFPNGMPDECEHGHQVCTDIIKRDKLKANEQINGKEDQNQSCTE